MLDVEGLTAGYGDVPVVHGIDLHGPGGELVALLGPERRRQDHDDARPRRRAPVDRRRRRSRTAAHRAAPPAAERGLGLITEERAVFRQLSTRINLDLGAGGVDGALALFPELERFLDRQAGLLSGGEQQMLVLARALAASPASCSSMSCRSDSHR